MNISNKKSLYRRRIALAVAVNIIEIIRIPFNLLAYPNRLLCRAVKALCSKAIRIRFIDGEYCGGCDRFGTKSCHIHSKNPYATIGISRHCYTVK